MTCVGLVAFHLLSMHLLCMLQPTSVQQALPPQQQWQPQAALPGQRQQQWQAPQAAVEFAQHALNMHAGGERWPRPDALPDELESHA